MRARVDVPRSVLGIVGQIMSTSGADVPDATGATRDGGHHPPSAVWSQVMRWNLLLMSAAAALGCNNTPATRPPALPLHHL